MAKGETVHVPVSFVLKPEHRNAESTAALRRVLMDLGFSPGEGGLATVSARIDAAGFTRVFGFAVTPVGARGRGIRDAGSAGGFAADREMAVPKAIEPWVSSLSVLPPPMRMV